VPDTPHRSGGDPAALAAYGSLAPGEENHWVVSRLPGEWVPATVKGWIFEIGWGPAEGWLGFIEDPEGPEVALAVLFSADLPRHWSQIDDFEGEGYLRRIVDVTLADGSIVPAQIYEALQDS